LIELVNSSNAEGIIFIGEKFCEYEYFEFPTLQETLKSKNIPSLLLEFSIEESLNIEAYKTRIQAFQELLENKKKRSEV
jgi:benzoyl-CoA reductase/2-hydroxyglutaryl-CoA dehydratase subunit BcrC/BadD/HgdB